jgi:hypothetical protein
MNQQPALSRCRSCQAPVWWRRNPQTKRWQPMNFDLVTNRRTDMPHHATCPLVEGWRDGRRRRRSAPVVSAELPF